MLPCRQWQTTRREGRGRWEEAVRMNLAGKGKQGSAERQAGSGKEIGRHLTQKAAGKHVGRGVKQRSKVEGQPCS
jgi:hypothetical protein